MGRPAKENPNTVGLTIKINAESLKKLQAYCEENKCSKGEAVRRFIDMYAGEKKK